MWHTGSITNESNNDYFLKGGNNTIKEKTIILNKQLPRKAL